MWTERVPVDSQKRRHGRTSSGGEEDQRMQSDLEACSWGGGREPGELNAADTSDECIGMGSREDG